MAIPVIYKGDDTDFRGSVGFTLKVVTSSNLNLSGCTVEVEVLGYRKSFPASATGELVCPFAFTAAETQRMPLGIHAATVRVYDSKGRVRTINNSIRVKVTNSVPEAYGKDDPQEVTLAVSTVDLETYAKKDDVTAAIEKALKDASASVKLHALTPEVTDTTVTLKPVDGAANYVEGKVEVDPARPVITSVDVNIGNIEAVFEFLEPETGEIGSNYAEANNIHIECALENYNESSPSGVEHFGYWDLRTTSEVVCANPSGAPICTIPSGITFTAAAVSSEKIDGENVFNEYIRLFDFFDLNDKIIWHASEGEQLVHKAFNDIALIQNATVSASRSSKICLPASTDSAKARRFILALETDVETEKAVEWQGGEVVEAVPGASKLVPGLTVWDVSEVAPGKFKVSRASSPAQSAPLTLTAPNGRVAELAVDDDLVLEVKEV